MTSASMTLRVHCTEDLLAAAPVVLGFRPVDSVVMLIADGDHVFHARTDLPSRADPYDAALGVAASLLGPATRNGARSVVFLFFSDDEVVVRRVWSALRRGCERARLRVVEAVRADGRRYYPLRGDRQLRELGVAYDLGAHPFLASAVMHGIVIEDDRESLAAGVTPDPAAQQAVGAAFDRAGLDAAPPPATGSERRHWGEWLRQVVEGHVATATTATDEEVARIGWAAQDLRVRDAAWALLRRADAREHAEFWRDVTRRTPDHLAAAPAALLGWAAWRAGHGALAWIAIDRCRTVAPGYALAGILAGLLDRAVPPDSLDPAIAWDEGLPA